MRSTIFLFVTFLLWGCQQKEQNYPLYRYLPDDTSSFLILKSNNYDNFVSDAKNNDFLKSLLHTENSFISGYSKLEAGFKKVYISFSRDKNKTYETTLITKFSNITVKDSLNYFGKFISNPSKGGIDTLLFDDKTIFVSLVDDVLVVSSTMKSVLSVIEKNKKVVKDSLFEKLFANADKSASATIFVNNNFYNPVFNAVFSATDFPKNFTDWFVLDSEISQEEIVFNGISLSELDQTNTIDLLKNTKGIVNQLPKIVPSNALNLTSFTFDKPSQYFENLKRFFPENVKDMDKKWEDIFLATSEVGYFEIGKERLVAVHSATIESFAKNIARESKERYEYKDRSIYMPANTVLLEPFYSPLIPEFKGVYCTQIEDFMVFSETSNSLKLIINANKNAQTIHTLSYFEDIQKSIFKKSSILKINHLAFNTSQERLPRAYKMALLQGLVEDQFYNINALVRKTVSKTGSLTNQMFDVTLDAPPYTTPKFYTNHRSKTKDILVQDTDNTLYLISNKGKIFWKKLLNGKIIGDPIQVDIYKNGKLQFAFVTEDEFMILDRNGKQVKPFYKKLKNSITQPLSVFDYEKDKNYRFVISQGSQIFIYDNKMNKVSGFRFNAKTDILTPPQHFRIGDKDYIVITEKSGKLNLLYRNGKVRIPIKETFDFSNNTIYLQEGKFVFTDKKGNLIRINQSGEVNKDSLNLDETHRIEATSKTLAMLSRNKLSIKRGGKQSDIVLQESKKYSPVHLFYIHDTIFISTTDLETKKVYLFNSQGTPFAVSPLFGTSDIDMADIDNDMKTELVVSGENNSIIVYKMDTTSP